MWTLQNRTSYSAERNWTRVKSGAHYWVVAVKATFDISREGGLTLADEQPAPVLAPEYLGEPGRSSLRYDSDLLAIKPGTDLLVHARAYAPRRAPATMVAVSLGIRDMRKVLVVKGARSFYRQGGTLTTTAPRPFVHQAMTYEQAFGGSDQSDADETRHRIDQRNPVGRGFTTRAAHLDGQPAHSVEYPTLDPSNTGPAGFGPIDRSWSPRLELAGTYDTHWLETRSPLLPEDYDERHALSAPLDQQSSTYLRGGEQVELLNMTPEGVLRFGLPRLHFGFATRFGAREVEHRARLTSVVVEAEAMRLMMVWQTSLLVPAQQVDQLDSTTITERRTLS